MTATNEFENLAVLLSITVVLVIIGMVATLGRDMGPVSPRVTSSALAEGVMSSDPAASHEVQIRFDQGIALLHAKKFDYAMTAFDRVLQLAPRMPEAHVNMGFALLGLQEYADAGRFFQSAMNLHPNQANAYWGLALALEGVKDYEGALGAMRSYIHLSTPEDPYLMKARSALWEWEAQLGRLPGITPLSAEEAQKHAVPEPGR